MVIGSGVGGLVSANLLAAHGWDVTVLEQHYRAGGYLHRFFRHGAGFDTGFHYVGSARPDQLFGRVLRHAGVYDRIQLDPLDPDGFDELRLPGMTLRVPAGADRWRDRLIEAFPHQRDPLHAFFAALEEAVRSYGLYRLDDSVRPEAILPWEELSLLGMFERVGITDARLRTVLVAQAFLYGVPPRDAPFGLHAIVHDHFADGGWTIRGGGDRLALALVRELRSRGGRIEFRARVQRIDVEAGNATRVHTADGRSFPVDLVVANTHPAAVAEMVPAGTFRRAYVERVSTTEPGVAHVAVYLRVRGELTEVARRNLYRLRTWDVGALERSATPESVPYYFLTAPGARDGRGEGVVLALCAASWEDWKVHDGVQPRPESYRAAKAAIAGALVRAIAEDFPGWEIDVVEASTPVSTRAYTLARAGAIYGHYHSVSQMGRYRLPIRTKVQNLLHVGQSVGFPGVCGASMTAYLALSEVPGLEGIVEELKRA